MKYMILIHSNPQFAERWGALSEQQQDEFVGGHYGLTDELAASGELVLSEGLAGPELSKRVTRRDGDTFVTDGPFAEVKEHLAGFYVVDCESADRVVQIAGRVPDAQWGLVEIRPVLDRTGWDVTSGDG